MSVRAQTTFNICTAACFPCAAVLAATPAPCLHRHLKSQLHASPHRAASVAWVTCAQVWCGLARACRDPYGTKQRRWCLGAWAAERTSAANRPQRSIFCRFLDQYPDIGLRNRQKLSSLGPISASMPSAAQAPSCDVLVVVVRLAWATPQLACRPLYTARGKWVAEINPQR